MTFTKLLFLTLLTSLLTLLVVAAVNSNLLFLDPVDPYEGVPTYNFYRAPLIASFDTNSDGISIENDACGAFVKVGSSSTPTFRDTPPITTPPTTYCYAGTISIDFGTEVGVVESPLSDVAIPSSPQKPPSPFLEINSN